MIEGNKKKPMTILEYITDAPREPLEYIKYLKEHYQIHGKYWKEDVKDEMVKKECVLYKIDTFIMELEDIKFKLERYIKEHNNVTHMETPTN